MKRINIDRSFLFTPSIYIMLRVKISGCKKYSNLEEAIRYSIKKFEAFQYRILQKEDGECYYVKNDKAREVNINRKEQYQSTQEFVNEQERIEFDLENGEFVRFVICRQGKDVFLDMVQHHVIGDGMSCLILLQEIMNNLSELEKGNRIFLSKRKIIPLNFYTEKTLLQYTELSEQQKNLIDALNRKWRESNNKIFYFKDLHEFFYEYWQVNKTKVISLVFMEEQVTGFVEICKQHNVTVNNAIITLLYKIIKEKCRLSIQVNLRMEEKESIGNYVSGIIAESFYNEKLCFWDNVKNIQKVNSSMLSKRKNILSKLLFQGCMDNSFIDAINFQTAGKWKSEVVDEYNSLIGRNRNSEFIITSNLGRKKIQEDYGNVKLEEVAFLSPIALGFDANIGIITVNGKMTISIQYHEKANRNHGLDYKNISNALAKEIIELGKSVCD